MKYAKIENDIVIQTQPNAQSGFIQVSDEVVCGMMNNGDGTFGIIPKTEAELLEQAKTEINNAIQNLLDTTAQSLRYDNIMSARSYAGYVNPFQAEAQSLAVWASECWVIAGQIEADVIAGTRPMPTVDEVLAELPVYGA